MYLLATCISVCENIQFICPFIVLFVILVFNFLSSLYIFNINPLLDKCLVKILRHSVGYLFTLSVLSFAEQNFLIFFFMV
jgi:hypothetical protein